MCLYPTLHLNILIVMIACALLLAAELLSSHDLVQRSIQHLEEFRMDNSSSETKRLFTNSQLHDLLLKKHGTPGVFEADVLCWPKCPAMKGGNPKHKAHSH